MAKPISFYLPIALNDVPGAPNSYSVCVEPPADLAHKGEVASLTVFAVSTTQARRIAKADGYTVLSVCRS